MAEETKKKPAPKKDAKTEAGAPAAEKTPKTAAAATAVVDPTKPVETPVVAAPTAAELLGEDANAKKIIKAKHARTWWWAWPTFWPLSTTRKSPSPTCRAT